MEESCVSQSVTQQTQQNLKEAGKLTSVHDACQRIKSNAIEIAATIVFLAWLAKEVWHALGLPPIPWTG